MKKLKVMARPHNMTALGQHFFSSARI